MARKSSKPISIKAARKTKQEKVAYPKPVGDDWKLRGWDQLWNMLLYLESVD